MATIKYDVSDVEAGGGGQQPQPSMYKGKIVSVTHRDKKSNGDATNDLEVVVSVGDEYANLWSYINLESVAARWKVREFTDAVGLPTKGDLTPQKLKALQGKPVLVKVSADTDLDGDYRGRVKNLFMPGTQEVDASDNGDDSEGGDDYGSWDDDDLKAELKDRGLKIAGRFTTDKAVAALEEYDVPEAEEEEEADTDGPAGEIEPELLKDLNPDPDFYSAWPDDDIKSFVEDLGIKGNIGGRYSRSKGVDAIVALADSVLGTTSDDAPDETTDEYDSWDDDDLQNEIDARAEQGVEIKISGRKSREKIIAALRADDGTDPF